MSRDRTAGFQFRGKGARRRPRAHHALCEGHIDCPTCGPDSCCKVVVEEVAGGRTRAVTVICLTCWRTQAVDDRGGGAA